MPHILFFLNAKSIKANDTKILFDDVFVFDATSDFL